MKLSESLRYPLTAAGMFWLVKISEIWTGQSLSEFGILPRSLLGLPGIIVSPFLHGNLEHLISNTPTFVVLGAAILYFYPRIAFQVFWQIWLITGIGVWLFARPAYHIGASGLIYGFAAFIFFSGLLRKDLRSLMLSVSIALLYNGLIYGIFPKGHNASISWESHLIGVVAGLVSAFMYRKMRMDHKLGENTSATDYDFSEAEEGYQEIENEQVRYSYTAAEPAEKEAARADAASVKPSKQENFIDGPTIELPADMVHKMPPPPEQ